MLTPTTSLCFQIPVTIIKPDEKAEIPIGVVIGSILAGLLLLLALVAVLWTAIYFCVKAFRFFPRREGLPAGGQNVNLL